MSLGTSRVGTWLDRAAEAFDLISNYIKRLRAPRRGIFERPDEEPHEGDYLSCHCPGHRDRQKAALQAQAAPARIAQFGVAPEITLERRQKSAGQNPRVKP